jgi:SNF2 family DNA or RNA helicase
MERELFLEIDGKQIDAKNAASKTIKCLQIANGAIYNGINHEFSLIHDEKIIVLKSIIEEAAGMPVLVAYHFKSDLQRLKSKIPAAVELDKNPETIKKWNAGEIPVLLAHPASAGHGLNLQDGGNILVYFAHWWDLEQRDQIFERIGPVRQMQSGHNRPVFVYNLIAEKTLDHIVLLRHKTKRDIQDLLLELRSQKP